MLYMSYMINICQLSNISSHLSLFQIHITNYIVWFQDKFTTQQAAQTPTTTPCRTPKSLGHPKPDCGTRWERLGSMMPIQTNPTYQVVGCLTIVQLTRCRWKSLSRCWWLQRKDVACNLGLRVRGNNHPSKSGASSGYGSTHCLAIPKSCWGCKGIEIGILPRTVNLQTKIGVVI